MKRWAALFGRIYLYQRGRAAALVLLAFFCVMLALGEVRQPPNAPESTALGFANAVSVPPLALRQFLFDGYQRSFPRLRLEQKVAIVGITEDSLKRIGQWPWPRDKLAALIDAIAAHQPAAIGLDIYMPEPDRTSPEQVAAALPVAQRALADGLLQLPSHDAVLARSLRAAPTVLGAAGFGFETLATSSGLRTVPVQVFGGDPLPYLQRFPYVLASLPELQVAAHGQALVSIEQSAVVRHVPLVAAVGDLVTPSLVMEMLRVASNSDAIEVAVDSHGIRSVAVAELAVPTQATGEVWLHFAPESQGMGRNISAAELLEGKVSPDALAGKLVLIGLTGSGLNDRRVTALGESVAGIEIQAQVLESMLAGQLLLRPWWIRWTELGLLGGIGLLMIWVVPNSLRRTGAAAQREPRHPGWWVTAAGTFFLALGFWLFRRQGLLFDGATMAVGFAGLLASLVSSSTLEVERDNRRLAAEQQQLREEAARLAGEMEGARRIQLGSLPDARRAFPGEKRFTIDALIEPAREVGGDLYDFFLIDERRLYFLIGDVSGKGVPASLFMAVTKALTRSFASRLAGGAAQIVTAANQDLSRDNVETLFVTLLLGVLNVDTGELELVNAGHDSPWRLGSDGALEQLRTPAPAAGPPLCVLEDFSYAVHRTQLLPGDRLCMVTDGITEAFNNSAELYGSARLRIALAGVGAGSPASTITRTVRDDVAQFVAGAEASDDLAVLVVHWIGPHGQYAPPVA